MNMYEFYHKYKVQKSKIWGGLKILNSPLIKNLEENDSDIRERSCYFHAES